MIKKEFDWTKLKTIRIDVLGLTQEKAARKLDCPLTTYRNWENGITTPSLAYYFKLKELFNL
jgi:DNA-binding XRE family transcriptional regulator